MTIDIFSDVVCPWCFIGKRRLEKALRLPNGGYDARVNWLAFELNPDMPREGMDRNTYLTAKFGGSERLKALDERVSSAGTEEDIIFAFDRIAKTPNTRDAHRLIWLAKMKGIQDEVVEALFRAYFSEARDIGDRGVLLDIAENAGFTNAEKMAFLDEGESLLAVQEEEGMARHIGINSVPSFIINNKYLISGAHPPESLASVFEEALKGS
ncbi:MAG: thioredoxin domain-containing protein [Deltaproteobacteria bacterium]|nr:thioredoxin domain-containing protein [Deltaproteobacteria bacterium]